MTNYVTFVVGEILLLILTICSLAAIFPRVRGTFLLSSKASGSGPPGHLEHLGILSQDRRVAGQRQTALKTVPCPGLASERWTGGWCCPYLPEWSCCGKGCDLEAVLSCRHVDEAFPKKLVGFSTWIDRTRWARNTWAMLAIFILVMANVVDMLSCLQYYVGPSNTTAGMEMEGRCLENPKYYNYVAVLSLIATIMLVQVSHMVKLTLMLLVAGAVAAINLYAWRPIFDEYDRKRFREYE
ncbi:hypothetical protein P7K49_028635 [Saguinus oedipus]|uniref:PGG domain-containing protein n=1 Tax=Saguinus oedipus TaxID=9490 RepID=A0ABQ9U6X7_SAGOE|nr:hypothetical protein P7K49_028635 [Saguinus oedipus]